MQAVDGGDSSHRQQQLSHSVDVDVLRSACGEKTTSTLGVTNAQPAVSENDIFITNTQCLPSISILKTSLVMGSVVPMTRAENRNVQIGSAILYSGCEENRNIVITNNRNKRR